MRNTLKVLVGVLGFFAMRPLSAQNTLNVVTSAVPFLRISPDARSGGMGELGVAISPDANAQFYNVAKYSFSKKTSGIGVTYTPWLKDLGLNDVFLASAAGYKKLDENQAISGSLRYFNLGNIEFTDNFGNSLGSGRPRELGLDFAYSRKLSGNLSLGIAIRYINSALANAQIGGVSYKPGNAVAGDLGIYYVARPELGTGLTLGASLSNLGSKISYTGDATQRDFIPANMTLGAMYTVLKNEVNKLSFGLDIHKLLVPTPPFLGDSDGMRKYRSMGVVESWFSSFGDAPGGFSEELKEYALSLGSEFAYNEQFAFRAGYFYENKNKGNRQYFSAGTGFRYSNLEINLSYLIPSGTGVNRNPLSNTIRFSMLFNLSPNQE